MCAASPKIDVGACRPGHRPDFWIVLLQPLLNQSFVKLLRAMQRLLTSDPKLRQEPPHRRRAQNDVELVLDHLRHHLARPQRERELQLQRILARHRIVNPPHHLAIQLRRTPGQRFRLQPIPAAASIARQPAVNSRSVETENMGEDFRALALLHAFHNAYPHLFERLVIQLASVVLSHAK